MKKRTLQQKKRILRDLNVARDQVGLPTMKGTTRHCLKCSRPFFSMGSWNRLCESCSSVIQKRDDVVETYRVGHP